jgi:hypothetical protein
MTTLHEIIRFSRPERIDEIEQNASMLKRKKKEGKKRYNGIRIGTW